MGKPRIAEEDYLLPEDLLEGSLEGEWVRVSAYSDGHRVSANGRDAYCGTPLVYTEEWWDRVQAWASRFTGKDEGIKGWSPTPYYLALDKRKGSQCSVCKKGKDWGADEIQVSTPKVELSGANTSFDERPFVDPTPAEKLEHQRFLSKVLWVARELGAEIVEPGTEAAAA